jgi:hypothetical protein
MTALYSFAAVDKFFDIIDGDAGKRRSGAEESKLPWRRRKNPQTVSVVSEILSPYLSILIVFDTTAMRIRHFLCDFKPLSGSNLLQRLGGNLSSKVQPCEYIHDKGQESCHAVIQ